MTHRIEDTTFSQVMELLIASGLEGLAEAVATLLNEAMKLERSRFLQAGPYERSDQRRGYAKMTYAVFRTFKLRGGVAS